MSRSGRYSSRLVVSVGLAFILTIAASAAAVLSFRRAAQHRATAQLDQASDLVLAHRLAQSAERKVAKSRSYLILADELYAQEMEDARSEFLSGLGELRGRVRRPGTIEALDRIAALESRHHRILREVLAKRRSGRPPRALAAELTEGLKPVRDELDSALRGLIELKESTLQQAQEEAAAGLELAGRVSAAAGLASMVAFLAVLALVRGLARAQADVEQSLRRSNAELDAVVAERTKELSAFNRELESFSYSVAHDLRTPLRAITNFSDLALSSMAGPGREAVQRIKAAGLRMSHTIDALLALSRLTRRPLALRQVDLSAAALELAELIRQAEPGRHVRFHVEPGLLDSADPDLIRVLLQNLLDNAWKFAAGSPDPLVEFGRAEIEGGPAYFVRDNGAGFDPAFAHKLFTPFERLHSVDEFPGTGIGLAAVERVVRRHGGTAWAEGRPGRGATFWFTLHRRVPSRERAR